MNLASPLGRRAWVHLHLPTGRYSIKIAGQPVFYAEAVTIADATFHVNDRLRAQFEAKPSRRTVHAHVVGTIAALEALPIDGERVSCNPFRFRGFATSDGALALRAQRVVLAGGGRILAAGLEADATVDARCAITPPTHRSGGTDGSTL